MSVRGKIAVLTWDVLVRIGRWGGRKSTIAIYGFRDREDNLAQRLAGRVMMSDWWPHENEFR